MIIRRLKEETPVKRMDLLPHSRESNLMKLLQRAYEQLKGMNWSVETRRQLLELQEWTKEENSRLFNEKWEQIIRSLDIGKKNPKKFWDNIRRLLGGKDNGPITYLWDNNRQKMYKEDKLERMMETWSMMFQITEEENNGYDEENERHIEEYLQRNNYRMIPYEMANMNRLDPNDPLTRPITLHDIHRIIVGFKNSTPGERGITKLILVKLPKVALQRYNQILNLLLSMGYFSKCYRNGLMVLTPKDGKDGRDPINYRPITLLEVPGKVLERVINDRFGTYLENNKKMNVNQYGFRKKRGTELLILKLYDLIALNQQNGGQCNIVCRDVAKAFDKVWHRGLKYKILQLRLPDIVEKILCSFLDDRTAQIKMFGGLSHKFDLKSGVPQGSILSPTLLIFYTADMPPPGPGATDIMFADDVTQVIEYPHRSKRFLARKTEREVERIDKYERKWKIKTNKDKFQLLSVSKLKPAEVRIDNRMVNFSDHISMLGLKLKRTGFNMHISQRLTLAKGKAVRLKRFTKLKAKNKCHLYKALIRSAMEYPNIPLCNMSRTNKNKWQKFQN